MPYSYEQVAKTIDHSLLNPVLSREEMEKGCQLAAQYGTASVCILPYYVPRCAELLRGTGVLPSTTIGFPHGANTTAVKLAEARQALADGAIELDMVVNISRVVSGEYAPVKTEITDIAKMTHDGGGKLKVIFENCYLNEAQKRILCAISSEAGADWIKTSTGYGSGGFSFEDVELMLQCAGPGVQVKAAGGVRDLDTLLRLMDMGATRFGATRTASMLDEYRSRLNQSARV